jgi:undecaprenyl-diphosphatase
MGIWDAILLGIVEGLTEFIPVSSTFHLIVTARMLGRGGGEFAKLFEVFIQSGAILAVLVLFWKRLSRDPALVKKTLAAFLPTVILGVIAYRTIKTIFFNSYNGMIAIFILVGFVFLIFERLIKKGVFTPGKTLASLSYRDAVLIGLAQALAFFPGAYDLFKTRDLLLQSVSSIPVLAVGFAVAFAVALFALRWLIRYLQSHTLNLFGFYRLAAGVLLLLAILFL